MTCFPQLSTGAAAQYPMVRRLVRRTVTNEATDGTRLKLADADASITEWDLEYSLLTADEMDGLKSFFESMEGRLGSFTFLDPLGNLLASSEAWDAAAWQRDPLVSITGGVPDPLGGTAGWTLRNTGLAGQRIVQTIEAPPEFSYCFSVYARSAAAQALRTVRQTEARDWVAGPDWQRLQFPGSSAAGGDTVTFGVELPPGGVVDVFGFQVEAQTGASGYKKTDAESGVYSRARFDSDILKFTATGTGQYSCGVRIIHGNHF